MDPTSLIWRAPTPADTPAWARCAAASEAVDQTGELDDETSLLECFSGVGYVAGEGWFAFTPDGEIAAWTWPACWGAGGPTRVIVDGGVHPDWRGQGLGTQLLEVGEARALAVLDRLAPSADHPGWVEKGVYDHHPEREDLFASRGYAPIRWFDEMRRPLAEPIGDVDVPDDLRMIAFEPRFAEAARVARNAAFADHWGSNEHTPEQWATNTVGGHGFRTDLSRLVLDVDDRIVGHAMSFTHEQEWAGIGHTEAWIGILGVDRAQRGRGVATALLNASMRAFAAEGLDYAALGVDHASPTGANRLYESLGFRRFQRWAVWARPVPGRPGPEVLAGH